MTHEQMALLITFGIKEYFCRQQAKLPELTNPNKAR
jgi:hypothetical protein